MDRTTRRYTLFLVPLGLLLATTFLLSPRPALSQGQGAPITGYLWSDTSGWVDLNCANSNVCGTNSFMFSIASDGTLSGYAWAENIGWVSAQSGDLSGCPTSPCIAKIQSNGALTGWLKAIAADNKGWDGWISLSGAGYGVSESGGVFSGYAWGSDVTGWLDFSRARTPYGTCTPSYSCSDPQHIQYTNSSCQTSAYATCVSPGFCSGGSSVCLYPAPSFNQSGNLTGHLQINPKIVATGKTATVTWNVSSVSVCTVKGDATKDSWSATTGSKTMAAINQQTTYTLNCAGLDGSTVHETATVNILPVFQER